MQGGSGRLGITDAERQTVIDGLRRRAAQGQLDDDELASRVSRARTAMTRAGLDSLVMDLPPDPGGPTPPEPARDPAPAPTPPATSPPPTRAERPKPPPPTTSTPPTAPTVPVPAWTPPAAGATPPTPAATPAPTPIRVGPSSSSPSTGGPWAMPERPIDQAAAVPDLISPRNLAPMMIALVATLVVGLLALVVAGRGGSEDEPQITAPEPDGSTATSTIDLVVPEPEIESEPTPAPTAPPTTAPPTTPPPPVHVELRVGTDIAPGRYTNTQRSFCTWNTEDTSGEIIGLGGIGGPAVVDLVAGDVLVSDSCGQWVPYAPPAAPATSMGDGDWLVGSDVAAGTYRSDLPGATSDMCMWERGTGFRHHYDEVVTYEYPGTLEVTVRDGERFSSFTCGTWTKV